MTDPPTFTPAPAAAPPYVREGERVLWMGKPTLGVLVRQILGLFVAFFFFGVFALGAAPERVRAGLLILPLILVFIIVLSVLRLRRTEYVLTDLGVYTRTGIIGHTVVQTTFDKITDISLKQDVVGRILGYAALHVNTAGSNTAPVQMDGLRDALLIKGHVESARERFLGGGRPEPGPPRRLPRFVPDRLLMTLTCPTTKKPFRRPKADEGSIVPCPHCQGRHKAEVKRPARARRG